MTMSGRIWALKIEWHPEAIEELRKLGTPEQRRIKKVLDILGALDDPRQKLVPYSANMKGFWKLRDGDIGWSASLSKPMAASCWS